MGYDIPVDHHYSVVGIPPQLKKFVLFDLDNCLCDDGHRTNLIDFSKTGNARYEAYHAAHTEDEASKEALNILMGEVMAGRAPIFITGRPDTYRSTTIAWLHAKVFSVCELEPSFLLWMRPAENQMPSGQLKRWLIKESPYELYQFVAAYDDFEDVLHGYRDMGIPCRKLAIHHDQNNHRGDKMHSQHKQETLFPAHDLPETFEVPEFTDVSPTGPDIVEQTAADILDAMADTFRERNKVYGSNFRMVAKLMAVLFPNGVPPELVIKDQFHLFELILVKLSRYAISNLTHIDSAHDMGVYAAMCESINKESK